MKWNYKKNYGGQMEEIPFRLEWNGRDPFIIMRLLGEVASDDITNSEVFPAREN